MNTTQFPQSPTVGETSSMPMLDTARESATEALESGERWVRENPIPAILTALGGGILIGALLGWNAAESRHRDYRDTCRELAREWQHRLHLG